ncbi:MAG: hypothetical protein ACOCXA_03110 [Planctomycetota bacterium]
MSTTAADHLRYAGNHLRRFAKDDYPSSLRLGLAGMCLEEIVVALLQGESVDDPPHGLSSQCRLLREMGAIDAQQAHLMQRIIGLLPGCSGRDETAEERLPQLLDLLRNLLASVTPENGDSMR